MAITAVLAVGGCRQAAGGVPVEGAASAPAPDAVIALAFDPDPPIVGAGTLVITLTRADGTPIEDAAVTARGDMNHAGMEPVDGSGVYSGAGVYRAPFNWTMGGDWIITVTASLSDGLTVMHRFEIVVGS